MCVPPKEGFKQWSHTSKTEVKKTNEIAADEEIIDYGPVTAAKVAEIIKNAKTVIWNGPCGVFEFDAFAKGTEVVARAIAESEAFSIAGGGDTLAAIDKFNLADKISHLNRWWGIFRICGRQRIACGDYFKSSGEWLNSFS